MAEKTKQELLDELEALNLEKEAAKDELENVKAELESARSAVSESTAEGDPNDPRRPVTVELFKDTGKYKDSMYVSINDYNAIVPRGVPVTMPYFAAQHIKEMLSQDKSTAQMITTYENELDANRKQLI